MSFKHLVKSFSTVELTAAGKPLEIAIVAGSIIFLLAVRMATEGIIRTLKTVGRREMPLGRIYPPTHQGIFPRHQHSVQEKKLLLKPNGSQNGMLW